MQIDLTQAEQGVLANIRDHLESSTCATLHRDGPWGSFVIDLANRVCPKVEWTDAGDGSIAICNGWTLLILPGTKTETWNVLTARFGLSGEELVAFPTIDAAKSAAVEWARGR